MITPSEVLSAAQAWYAAGYCVVPPREDGTKRPYGNSWETFQHTRPTDPQMVEWFRATAKQGIGLVCGKVSGNLEMLELEGVVATDNEFNDRIGAAIEAAGLDPLWQQLLDGYSEWTPSGGLHILYRILDRDVPGNTKIAQRPKDPARYTDKDRATLERAPRAIIMETLIETRGEGGYVVVAPSQGPVHPSGNPWTLGWNSNPGDVPTITWDQREALFAALSTFDIPAPRPARPERVPVPHTPMVGTGLRVGDDFNARGDWDKILTPHGWTLHHVEGNTIYWERPGGSSTGNHSATTGHDPSADRLYVFSSATEFPTHEPLSKLHVYAVLEHGGDYRAAVKALAAAGYGEKLPPRSTVTQAFGDFVPSNGSQLHVPAQSWTTDTPAAGFEAPQMRPNGATVTAAPPLSPVPAGPRKRYMRTSVGNAERMVDSAGRDFRHVVAKGESYWMAWDGMRWVEDHGNAQVNMAAVAMTYGIVDEAHQLKEAAGEDAGALKDAKAHMAWAMSSQMNGTMNGTLAQFGHRPEVVATPDAFDVELDWLNMPTGMYNLVTHTMHPHDRSKMFTKLFGVHYDPAATAPKFEAFVEAVIPDPQMRRFVQRAMGYTLTGRPNQRALMVLHGLKRTGKSQFANLMQALFGDYGYTAMASAFHKKERSDGPTPGQHSLKGRRFVTISEFEEGAVLDEDALKRFTGTDKVSTRGLYQGDSNWTPQCVIWLPTNNMPHLSPDDAAVWDRVKVVQFPTTFSADGAGGTVKEVPDYAAVLFAEEGPGILNWVLAGLREFQELGGLAQPDEVATLAEDYRREADTVSMFWGDMVETGQAEVDPEARVDLRLAYRGYAAWCDDNRIKNPVGIRKFNARLRLVTKAEVQKSNGFVYLVGHRWTLKNGIMGQMVLPEVVRRE